MDSLKRIGLLLLLLVVGVSAYASGAVTPIPSAHTITRCWSPQNGWGGGCFGAASTTSTDASITASQAMWAAIGPASQCQGWAGAYQVLTATGFRINAQNCMANQNMNTSYNSTSLGPAPPPTCPANSVSVGSTCQCNAGFVPNSGATACVGVCAATTGLPLGTGEVTALVAGPYVVPASMCSDGCKYTMNGSGEGAWGALNGVYTYWGKASDWTGTGAACTSSPTVPGGGGPSDPPGTPQPAASAPPKGMCPGTVNGVAVNVPCSSGGSTSGGGAAPPSPGASGAPPTPSAPGAPGPGSFSPSPPASAPPGSKPGEKGTSGTCEGDRCSQTECVIVLKADLSMEKQCGTTYEDKGTFCARQPGSPQCLSEKGTFNGSCAGFVCTGDAVQCAMAKEQHIRNCQLMEPTDESAEGLAAIALGKTRHTNGVNWRAPDTEIDIGVRATAAAVNPYAASCPADSVINVAGANITIPMSSACTFLQALGLIAVSITVLTCAGWLVTKGV